MQQSSLPQAGGCKMLSSAALLQNNPLASHLKTLSVTRAEVVSQASGIFTPVEVEGVYTQAMVDSGSDINIASLSFMKSVSTKRTKIGSCRI